MARLSQLQYTLNRAKLRPWKSGFSRGVLRRGFNLDKSLHSIAAYRPSTKPARATSGTFAPSPRRPRLQTRRGVERNRLRR